MPVLCHNLVTKRRKKKRKQNKPFHNIGWKREQKMKKSENKVEDSSS